MAIVINSNQIQVKDANNEVHSISILADQTIQQTKQSILDAINSNNQNYVNIDDVKQAFADIFNKNNQYKIGQYVLYKQNNEIEAPAKLYKYIRDHESNSQWNAEEVTEVKMGSQLNDLVKISIDQPVEENDDAKIWVKSNSSQTKYRIMTENQTKQLIGQKVLREGLKGYIERKSGEFAGIKGAIIVPTYIVGRLNDNNTIQTEIKWRKSTNPDAGPITISPGTTYYFYSMDETYCYRRVNTIPRIHLYKTDIDENFQQVTEQYKATAVNVKDGVDIVKICTGESYEETNTDTTQEETNTDITQEETNTNTTQEETDTDTTQEWPQYKIIYGIYNVYKGDVIISPINLDTILPSLMCDFFKSCVDESGLINMVLAGADNTGEEDCSLLLNTIFKCLIFMPDVKGIFFPAGRYKLEEEVQILQKIPIEKEVQGEDGKKKKVIEYKQLQAITIRGETYVPEKLQITDLINETYEYGGTVLQFQSYKDENNYTQEQKYMKNNLYKASMFHIHGSSKIAIENITFSGNAVVEAGKTNDNIAKIITWVDRNRDKKYYPVNTIRLGFPLRTVPLKSEDYGTDTDYYDTVSQIDLNTHPVDQEGITLEQKKQRQDRQQLDKNQYQDLSDYDKRLLFRMRCSLPTQYQKIAIDNKYTQTDNSFCRLEINNCIFYGFETGIYLGGPLSQINNCVFQKCGTAISNHAVDSLINSPYIQWCKLGIDVQSGNIRIMNARIEEIETYGIYVHSSQNVISGGWIDRTGYAGICVFNTIQLQGNTINNIYTLRGGGYYGFKNILEETTDSTQFRKGCGIYIGNNINSTFNLNVNRQPLHDIGSDKTTLDYLSTQGRSSPKQGVIIQNSRHIILNINGDANNVYQKNCEDIIMADKNTITNRKVVDSLCYIPGAFEKVENILTKTDERIQKVQNALTWNLLFKNWLNPDEILEGYEINGSGSIVQNENRSVTGYIPVKEGDTIYFTGIKNGNLIPIDSPVIVRLVTYTKNKEPIAGTYPTYKNSYTIPEDNNAEVAYCRICYNTTAGALTGAGENDKLQLSIMINTPPTSKDDIQEYIPYEVVDITARNMIEEIKTTLNEILASINSNN